MAKAKKFGAYAGVFTPSILTILGVIMYMRLGWVVGQAGLVNALIIILLAHVISLSTGLSVSSIATDKRIKAGGIYYILSRSLGLPMGGAIGITLFIGTALSISLYLVGFAENFLSIEIIRDFLGLEENKFGYQIVGTAAILVLVIIAFISTSLAIKTQYYILGAIVLSLGSIVAGFFLNPHYHPQELLASPAPSAIPMELIFAVFFPAVTGFTAGVAMSGDLKDPKKSIPFGTMTAIITGLAVYILLAIAIAFFVNRDMLLTDINYLMKVAWFSPLVVAGIWGATLSSALGGILGGPRILQAMSADRIGPRIFAHGYGINNEPRNALLLIFLIAEAGILIGELNVIAGIVSMFYLASYGFINLAYYLESWASADFRPSFKINRLIGLIGFLAAFGVMFRLDMVSMFAALIIMLGIYFFLKRKQLKLDFGDVWQSVWSSLMRTALDRMDKADEVERNWQPNIILFSGGTQKRPHLISLGKSLVGRHGVLSNFDLIENPNANVLFPKKKQSLPGDDPAKGVFTRRQTVKDVYEGIEMISRTYGFSGLEPNTVLLGWSRQSRDPLRFATLLKTLYDLDLNVLLLGYDKRVGYGKKQTIDIWIRDKSNHGNLALTLSRLLVLSDDWQSAHVRLLIVNNLNAQSETIYRNMEEILDNMRIDAEMKVINNQIERRPFYDIVEFESAHTDLVFLEIPGIKAGKEIQFVEDTAQLLEKIGTVMLIEASSSFKKLRLGTEKAPEAGDRVKLPEVQQDEKIPDIMLPLNPVLREELTRITDTLHSISADFENGAFAPLLNSRLDKITALRNAVDKAYGVMQEKIPGMQKAERTQLIAQLKTGLLVRLGRTIEDQIKRIPAEKEDHLHVQSKHLLSELETLIGNIPKKLRIRYYSADLQINPEDPLLIKIYKKRIRLFNKSQVRNLGFPYSLRLQSLSSMFLPLNLMEAVEKELEAFGNYTLNTVFEWQKLMYAVSDGFSYLEAYNGKKVLETLLEESKETLDDHLDRLQQFLEEQKHRTTEILQSAVSNTMNSISRQSAYVPANSFITGIPRVEIKRKLSRLTGWPNVWASNQTTLLRSIHIESQLLLFEFRLSKTIRELVVEHQRILEQEVLKPIQVFEESLETPREKSTRKSLEISGLTNHSASILQLSYNKVIDKAFRNIKSNLSQLPGNVEVFSEDAINELTNHLFEVQDTIKIPVFRLVDYRVQNQLFAPMVGSMNQFVSEIRNSLTGIEDASRLIQLSQDDTQNENTVAEFEQFDSLSGFIADQKGRIIKNRESISEKYDLYRKTLLSNLDKTGSDLHLYRLTKFAENNVMFTRREAKEQMRFLRKQAIRLRSSWQKIRADIWYRQSEARLLAKRITESGDHKASAIHDLLNLKELLSTKPSILEKLPFYYQQLFLSKYNYQPEFWYSRDEQLTDGRKTIKRYRSGNHGFLVVTGPRGSGKSFFAQHLFSKVKQTGVKTLTPPVSGSMDPAVFEITLGEMLGQHGNVESLLSGMPEGSVIILEDLELWWERSIAGKSMVEWLFGVLQQFYQHLFFVLLCNTHAYKIIKQLQPFSDYTLQNIELSPFSSKELQEMILFRHRTSGFNLQVDSIMPTGLTQARQARLFNRIFRFSGGNAGAALHCWIANIKDYRNQTVFMQSPVLPDIQIFQVLPAQMKIVLMQFILHKRLTSEKLARIMQDDERSVSYVLQYLERAGLIHRRSEKSFEIDPYMQYHVGQYLMKEYDTTD